MSKIVTLNAESKSIQHLCKKDKRLAKIISMVGPISYYPYEDGFAFIVHEIIEQMLSIKAGAKIYARLEDLCNGKISIESIDSLTDEQIRSIGTSSSKVTYIRGVTDAVKYGAIDFSSFPFMNNKDVIKTLTSLKCIGNWTVKMYLIFVLDRPDILPTEDVAFLQAYEWLYKTKDRSKESVEKRCKKWKPYSSVAARYLYRALDSGLTKEEFHLYK